MTKPTARQRLTQAVLEEIESWEEADPHPAHQRLISLLHQIHQGLVDLDLGEVPDIFKPNRPLHKGTTSAQTRRLRLQAVAYVEALCRRGYSYEAAEAEIADSFGLGPDVIHKWRQSKHAYPQSYPDEVERTRQRQKEQAMVDKTAMQLGWVDKSPDGILENARRAGKRYRTLHPNKAKVK